MSGSTLPGKFLGLLVLAALSHPAAAGSVLVVDDGPGPGVAYNQIAAAVSAAADGDVVLVRSGAYLPFTIGDRTLAVIADTGALVNVLGTIRVDGLGPGKTVVLRGLRVPEVAIGPTREGLLLTACLGSVRVEACDIRGKTGSASVLGGVANGAAGARIESCADVAFARTTLRGGAGASVPGIGGNVGTTHGGAALRCVDADVAAADCTVVGGAGGIDTTLPSALGGDGGDGISAAGGNLYLSGAAVLGGAGGAGGGGGAPGTAQGGDGGNGCEYLAEAKLRVLNATFAGGAAGAGGAGGLAPGSGGEPFGSVAGSYLQYPGTARHHYANAPVREGGFVAHAFGGAPSETVLVAFALAGSDALIAAGQGPFLLGTTLFTFAVGTIGSAGTAALVYPVPELGPGVGAAAIHSQAFFSGPGGVATIAPFSALVLLDSAY